MSPAQNKGGAMSKVVQGLDALTKAMMILAAFFAFGLAFMILVDVTARALNIKFYGVAEYVRNTIIVIVFLQLPYAIRIASMLRVDIFVNALPKASRLPIIALGNILGLLFFAGITAGALPPAYDAWVNNEFEGEGVVRVAAWPARFSIVYGCGLAALFYLFRIIDAARGREGPQAPEDIPQH
jgi:TRAP-type C4-dicarboxylate transport system permease small subunit